MNYLYGTTKQIYKTERGTPGYTLETKKIKFTTKIFHTHCLEISPQPDRLLATTE